MLEDANFDFTCPACKHSFKIRVNQVGKTIACPHCHQQINLKDDGFSKGIKSAENQLNHLFKGLK